MFEETSYRFVWTDEEFFESDLPWRSKEEAEEKLPILCFDAVYKICKFKKWVENKEFDLLFELQHFDVESQWMHGVMSLVAADGETTIFESEFSRLKDVNSWAIYSKEQIV